MSRSHSLASSTQNLLPQNDTNGNFDTNLFIRDSSGVSANDLQFSKILKNDDKVGEQTLLQVEFRNEELLRKVHRSELAGKRKCLTRRWQTILVASFVLLGLAGGIGGVVYWITIPKVITQPYLLYGESCTMDSRSCDATRNLWCPAGICVCISDFTWNATAQNCSCGQYENWTGVICQGYGYYGDPCTSIPCRPTLICGLPANQTYATGQDICLCNDTSYLDASSDSNQGTCLPRVTYNQTCKTEFDCQDGLGLTCASVSGTTRCQCNSTTYWDGTTCMRNAFGWESCNSSVPCDSTRGLTCTSGLCECDAYSYWDNVTTLSCQLLKTYAVSCQYNFQCNTTVNLSCPSTSTGCNCYATSIPYICDCQSGNFWDGQRCIGTHTFNGTCPGQYACSSNLVCYLGHCICPGNMCESENVQFTKMSSSQSRHVYTREQRAILEGSFARQSHPDIHEKERLAQLLNCNLIQISNWFQNHRRRVKKQEKLISSSSASYQQSEADNEHSSYYYYYYHHPPQYVYSSSYYPHQSYDQTMAFDPFVTYYRQ